MSTRQPFFCDLCAKGYARISELNAHESSYDHHHRKRAKDLRDASKDPRRLERARNTDMTKIVESENKKSKPKRGFKSAFGTAETVAVPPLQSSAPELEEERMPAVEVEVVDESGPYNPREPTSGWD